MPILNPFRNETAVILRLRALFSFPVRLIIILFAIMWTSLQGSAVAEVFVTPLRALISKDQPTATFSVSNPSDRLIEVQAEWIDMAASPRGYEPIHGPDRARISAAPYLIMSPSRVRLKPGERTDISVALNEKMAINFQERRSHVVFTAAAVRTPLRKTSGGLMADIDLAVSVPVIVRTIPAASISRFRNTHLGRDKRGNLTVETSLKRSGTASLYGELVAEFTASDDKSRVSARLDNVSVHFDTDEIDVSLSLGVVQLPAGNMALTYVGQSEYQGSILARKSFAIAAPPEK